MLRWDPPVHCTFRRATKDTEIDGVPVGKGQMVIPIWGSGGRDPEVFDNADEIDIDRPNLREHMGFGHGPHFCAAAELARLESKIAFTKIFAAWSDFEVDEERSDLGHLPSFSTHGRRKVVFRFTRA